MPFRSIIRVAYRSYLHLKCSQYILYFSNNSGQRFKFIALRSAYFLSIFDAHLINFRIQAYNFACTKQARIYLISFSAG
jgi:hypothetical protein